jgi:hypothetical protein
MRPWPIDSLALRASKEFFVLMKNEIWNLSLDLLLRNWIEKGIAKETPGKDLPLIQLDVSFLNEFFQLEERIIFCNSKDQIFRSFWDEFRASS